MVDFMKGKTIHRKSVGVRIADDAVCRAVLEALGRPLLCTSVHVAETLSEDTEVGCPPPPPSSALARPSMKACACRLAA